MAEVIWGKGKKSDPHLLQAQQVWCGTLFSV